MNEEATQSDFEKVKGDVSQLVADVGSWISTTSAEMHEKWDETRPVLEEKLAHAESEARHYASASAGAASEIGKGFAGAFEELKKAYAEARAHFKRPTDADEKLATESELEEAYE